MLTAQERTYGKLLLDQELRRRLKIRTNKVKPLMSQCKGSTYLGGRCQNTGNYSGFCYAHKGETHDQ